MQLFKPEAVMPSLASKPELATFYSNADNPEWRFKNYSNVKNTITGCDAAGRRKQVLSMRQKHPLHFDADEEAEWNKFFDDIPKDPNDCELHERPRWNLTAKRYLGETVDLYAQCAGERSYYDVVDIPYVEPITDVNHPKSRRDNLQEEWIDGTLTVTVVMSYDEL
jgi:hypothetical protein